MRFDAHDWQFWTATAIAGLSAAWLLRAVLPIPYLSARRRAGKTQRRATLTVGGKPLERR